MSFFQPVPPLQNVKVFNTQPVQPSQQAAQPFQSNVFQSGTQSSQGQRGRGSRGRGGSGRGRDNQMNNPLQNQPFPKPNTPHTQPPPINSPFQTVAPQFTSPFPAQPLSGSSFPQNQGKPKHIKSTAFPKQRGNPKDAQMSDETQITKMDQGGNSFHQKANAGGGRGAGMQGLPRNDKQAFPASNQHPQKQRESFARAGGKTNNFSANFKEEKWKTKKFEKKKEFEEDQNEDEDDKYFSSENEDESHFSKTKILKDKKERRQGKEIQGKTMFTIKNNQASDDDEEQPRGKNKRGNSLKNEKASSGNSGGGLFGRILPKTALEDESDDEEEFPLKMPSRKVKYEDSDEEEEEKGGRAQFVNRERGGKDRGRGRGAGRGDLNTAGRGRGRGFKELSDQRANQSERGVGRGRGRGNRESQIIATSPPERERGRGNRGRGLGERGRGSRESKVNTGSSTVTFSGARGRREGRGGLTIRVEPTSDDEAEEEKKIKVESDSSEEEYSKVKEESDYSEEESEEERREVKEDSEEDSEEDKVDIIDDNKNYKSKFYKLSKEEKEREKNVIAEVEKEMKEYKEWNLKGRCEEMCSSKEIKKRMKVSDLQIFEIIPGSNPIRTSKSLAVAEHRRNAQAQEDSGMAEAELRNPVGLQKSMNHLINLSNFKKDDVTYDRVNHFLWNRFREIAIEYQLQNYNTKSMVIAHEQIVRFSIYTIYKTINSVNQQIALNKELLSKTILTLKEKYDLFYRSKSEEERACRKDWKEYGEYLNEGEIRAYDMIINCKHHPFMIHSLANRRPTLINHPLIQLAIQFCIAYHQTNYVHVLYLIKTGLFFFLFIFHFLFSKNISFFFQIIIIKK